MCDNCFFVYWIRIHPWYTLYFCVIQRCVSWCRLVFINFEMTLVVDFRIITFLRYIIVYKRFVIVALYLKRVISQVWNLASIIIIVILMKTFKWWHRTIMKTWQYLKSGVPLRKVKKIWMKFRAYPTWTYRNIVIYYKLTLQKHIHIQLWPVYKQWGQPKQILVTGTVQILQSFSFHHQYWDLKFQSWSYYILY